MKHGTEFNLRSPIARGFTLVELLLSVTVISIVMVGLSSALLIASRAVPDRDPFGAEHSASAALLWLCDEIRSATWLIEHEQNSVTFTVPDRSGNGLPERIRYKWSGVAGDPLVRSVNDEPEAPVLNDVSEFAMRFVVSEISESVPGAVSESAEYVLASALGSDGGYSITNNNWLGVHVQPVLSYDTQVWRITRFMFRARQSPPPTGRLFVQLRPATASGTPASTIIEQVGMNESDLSPTMSWQTIHYTPTDIPRDQARCIVVVRSSGDSPVCELETLDVAGGVESTNGSTWTYKENLSPVYRVYGAVRTVGEPTEFPRQFFERVEIRLRTGQSNRLTGGTALLNRPHARRNYWRIDDAGANPTLDWNGDGTGDWMRTNAAVNGRNEITLQSRPAENFVTPFTAEFRGRITASNDSLKLTLNADWKDGLYAPLELSLLREINAQRVELRIPTQRGNNELVARVDDLGSEELRIRLRVDPEHSVVSLQVDDFYEKSFQYEPISPPAPLPCVQFVYPEGNIQLRLLGIHVNE